MKNKFYVVRNCKIKIIVTFYLFCMLLICFIIYKNCEDKKFVTTVSIINTSDIKQASNSFTNILGEENIEEAKQKINLKEYENMKKEIAGYKVVGKISIPKIEIEKYILEKTNEQSLRKAVTKICGPNINQTGNFCMAGHNYTNVFGKISKLEVGDTIKITDTFNRTVEYRVYCIEKVDPFNTKCLEQDTNGEREITLVTCTLGALKRVIVKAIEIYD